MKNTSILDSSSLEKLTDSNLKKATPDLSTGHRQFLFRIFD